MGRGLAFAMVTLWCVPNATMGADWFFQPAVTVGAGYEGNANLTEQDPIDSMRYDLDVSALAGRRTERSQIAFGVRGYTLRYPGNDTLDSDDLSARLAAAYRLSELDFVSFDASYDRTTSRTSELTTTGNIQGNAPLNTYTLRPSWRRRLTERSDIGLSYAYTSARYEGNSTGLVNYDQQEVDASYGYLLTERASFVGTLTATFYNPQAPTSLQPLLGQIPSVSQSYSGYAATLGLTYAISETLTGEVFIGPQQIRRDTSIGQASAQGTSNGATYGIRLAKQFERSTLRLGLESGAVPTGSGEPLAQDKLSLDFSYELTPRLRVTVPASLYRNETINFGGPGGKDRRIFLQTEPRLSWRISEDLYLKASYRYQYQRYEQSGATADSNAVFLSLSYVWPTETAPVAGSAAP